MPLSTDVKRAFEALNNKLLDYNRLFQYANGDQPLVYSTDRLREAFRDLNAHFSQNWCSVVINASLDRLILKGWDVEDKTINQALDDFWNQEHVQIDAQDAHYGALVTREAFIIVWPDADGKPELYYNDPRMCHVFYSRERPKEKEFAAKWWSDGAVWHLTLYYPDRIEYYVTRGKSQPSTVNSFQPADPPTATNEYGVIPVFHVRLSRQNKGGELDNIITLQDAVNKLFSDMMVSAEFGAFPQRYIVSQADTKALKNGPHIIWDIPASDGQGENTQVGQFSATPLDNYLTAIDKIANSIAIISRTPKHYFFNAGASLSGDALIAMEAPLNKKVEQYQELFGAAWQEIGAFVARLLGKTIEPQNITPVWKPAQSIQPYTEAQTRQLAIAAGIPLETQLRREGWGLDEINQMRKDDDEEKKRNAKLAPLLLDAVRGASASSNDNPDDTGSNANQGDVNNG